MKKVKEIQNKKYILRRAKNNKRREKHIGAAIYGKHKKQLQREADRYARIHFGYARMSISAYINIKLLLPH